MRYCWVVYLGRATLGGTGFFQPVHVDHLVNLLPIVLPFLGLEPGFKFITDTTGYEDVWLENKHSGKE